jgi:hypothetical protein
MADIMRWTLRISFLLFLAWLAFLVSPFWALYDLSRAVEAKDVARITERVNFTAVRASLSRQIVGAYVDQQDLGALDRDFAINAGTSVINPVVEELVTPEALADLLQRGWPPQLPRAGRATSPLRLDLGSFGTAWQAFITSETQGFRSITIPLPPGEDRQKQFRLTLRLRGATWRLTGIDLPKTVREALIKRASQAVSKRDPK